MNLTLLTHLTLAVVMDFGNGRISNRLIVSGLIWGLAFRLLGEGSAGAYWVQAISSYFPLQEVF